MAIAARVDSTIRLDFVFKGMNIKAILAEKNPFFKGQYLKNMQN